MTFHVEQPRERHRCSVCGSAEVWDQGGADRTFRTVSIGSKPAFIQPKVPRVLCFECGLLRQVKIGFADPKKRYTRAFERSVLELSRVMTIQDVAKHLDISWDTVKDIQAASYPKSRNDANKSGYLRGLSRRIQHAAWRELGSDPPAANLVPARTTTNRPVGGNCFS